MKSINMNSRLLTVDELANMLGKTKKAVYCMVCRGTIPYIKLGNAGSNSEGRAKSGALRFDLATIQDYIASRSVNAFKPIDN